MAVPVESRPSTRAARLAWLSALCVAVASCGGGGGAPASEPPPAPPPPPTSRSVTMTKVSTTPNPTGLKVGFWEVINQQAATLPLAGKRPLSRAGYAKWVLDEVAPGQYVFPADVALNQTHAFGEQLVTSIDLSSTVATSGMSSSIPSFYTQDITDPATRAAAKKFLYAYVQHVLQNVGPVVLTIDYEICSNWRLSSNDAGAAQRAQTWGAWYLEAAGVARQAAADLGMSSALKLQPIVNGDPFASGNPIAQGAAANAWLVNAVAASDGLALDTYHSDPNQAVTDPSNTLDIIQFWIDHYAAGKPVMLTENGFTTITQQDPTITRASRQMKLTGTEQQQSDYYGALFTALRSANAAGGRFHNQLRAVNIWSNLDNAHADAPDDIYFGLVRPDGSRKPAAATVAAAIAALEADAHDAPTQAGPGTDVTAAMPSGVSLTTTDGDAYDVVRYVDTVLPAGPLCHLTGSAAVAGTLLVQVNGQWQSAGVTRGAFDIDLGASACRPGASNVVQVQASGARFPFTQTLANLALKTS